VTDGVYAGNASSSLGKIQYDDLNRLLSLTNAGGTFNYGYNSIGNLLTNQESGTGNYVYGTIRPHAVRSANGVWFTYDQNGNVVIRGRQRLDYDVNNHLSRVTNTNGTTVTFGYDASGARLWEQIGTNAPQVWIGGNYEEKGGQTLYHIYAGGRQVCTFDSTGTNVFQYYHSDNLTSTSIQTDQNGSEIQNFTYTAFGQSRYTQSPNAFKMSRRYTGQVLDDATGLYYYNARYYDPILGRFTQPDAIIPNSFNPQSYNRYSYVQNNPLRFTDPSGNAPELIAITYNLNTGGGSATYQDHQFGQGYGIGLHSPPSGPLFAAAVLVGGAFQIVDTGFNMGMDKVTPRIDPNKNPYADAANKTARGLTLAAAEMAAAGGLAKLTGGGGALKAAQTGAGGFSGSTDEAYAAIRASTTDVADIAANTGIKPQNIQKVKDHLFVNNHLLDRYVDQGVPATLGQFDSDISIAQAWNRLQTGTHTADDIQLLRHETAEAWYMKRHGPGYNAAHNAAQDRFPAPADK